MVARRRNWAGYCSLCWLLLGPTGTSWEEAMLGSIAVHQQSTVIMILKILLIQNETKQTKCANRAIFFLNVEEQRYHKHCRNQTMSMAAKPKNPAAPATRNLSAAPE